MKILTPLLVAAAVAGAAWPALAGGIVQVNFVKPDQFADIGRDSVDRSGNLKILQDHMTTWGARLPDGQALNVDVLDVDLAGEVRPTRRLSDIRVLRGSVDWPRMTLRWSLVADGRTLKSGLDKLNDMAYLGRMAGLRQGHALAYDLRMLDDWFRERIAAPAP